MNPENQAMATGKDGWEEITMPNAGLSRIDLTKNGPWGIDLNTLFPYIRHPEKTFFFFKSRNQTRERSEERR